MNKLFFILFTCLTISAVYGQEVFPFKDNNDKYGLMNEKAHIILAPHYQMIHEFSGGRALVKLNDRYGYINTAGKLVIPIQYKEAGFFKEGLATFRVDSLYGFIDTTGKIVLPAKYYYAEFFSDGLAYIENGHWNNKDFFWGFIDKKGKMIIRNKGFFPHAGFFQDGMTIVDYRDSRGGEGDGTYGYMNKTGKIVLPIKYWSASSFTEGVAFVGLQSDFQSYRLINKTGKVVSALKFSDVKDFSEGLAAVAFCKYESDGEKCSWGYINKTGKLVIPAKYSEAEPFNKGLAAVTLNGKKIKIDKTGKAVQ